jgi:hypothetical protein
MSLREMVGKAAVVIAVLALACVCGEILIHVVAMVSASMGIEQTGGHTG